MADLAVLNVKQCRMKHDCHSTTEYPWAGQNIYSVSYSGYTGDDLVTFISEGVEGWYSEKRNAVQADIDKCCDSISGKATGHFTQVVTDRSIQVGCAIVKYSETVLATGKVWYTALMTCNYAFTNFVGAPVYVSGNTASGCITGTNPNFPALCSVDEPIIALP
jgi:hypothetical protein